MKKLILVVGLLVLCGLPTNMAHGGSRSKTETSANHVPAKAGMFEAIVILAPQPGVTPLVRGTIALTETNEGALRISGNVDGVQEDLKLVATTLTNCSVPPNVGDSSRGAAPNTVNAVEILTVELDDEEGNTIETETISRPKGNHTWKDLMGKAVFIFLDKDEPQDNAPTTRNAQSIACGIVEGAKTAR